MLGRRQLSGMYGRSKFVMSEEDLNALKHQLSDPSLRETLGLK